jgi:hypothetical protein
MYYAVAFFALLEPNCKSLSVLEESAMSIFTFEVTHILVCTALAKASHGVPPMRLDIFRLEVKPFDLVASGQ